MLWVGEAIVLIEATMDRAARSGPKRGTWKKETTGEQGDQLLDLVYRIGKHDTITAAMDSVHELDQEHGPFPLPR